MKHGANNSANLGTIENSYFFFFLSQGMPCRPDIIITTWSDSPDENVLTLCRVSRILLLLISGGEIYDLYRDVPLDRVLYVQFQDFNSPIQV